MDENKEIENTFEQDRVLEEEERKAKPIRKLWLGVICLTLVGVVALGVHGKRMRSLKSGVDYEKEANWAVLEAEESDKPVDVFYLCPSVYDGGKSSFNMPMNDQEAKRKFKGEVSRQSGIYDKNSRVFAPYYRQMSLQAQKLAAEEQEQYQEIALEDVEAAFQYYMDHYNQGRPVVLAGFAQGSDLVVRLMKDYYVEESMREKLVAAYIPGRSLGQEELMNNPQLVPAAEETDYGVIVTCLMEDEDALQEADYSLFYRDLQEDVGKRIEAYLEAKQE